MRNKSTIIALLTVFTLICGYNLFWTYQQYSLESRVTPYRVASDSIRVAKPDSAAWTTEDLRITHDFDSIQSTLATERQEAAARSFTLGLDLQGGMYVTMEVKISDLINQLASEPEDPQFMAAIACADQKRAEEALPYIDLFIDCFQENVPDGNLGATFTNDEYEIGFGTSDDEVIQFLRDQAVSGMDRTFQIIRARIDGFGVVSPNLQKLDNNRILLELPGVKDEERVKKLLKQTAELEFYVGYSYRESYPILRLINEKLKEIQGIVEVDTAATENIASAEDAETPAVDDSTANDSSSVDTLAADTAKAFEDMTPEEQEEARAQFRAENPLFAVLGQFDFSQPRFTESNTPLVGFAAEADIPTINKYFEMDEVQEIIPEDMKFVWGFKPTENGIVELISVKKSEDGGAALGGDAVSDARQDFDGNTGEPVVSMTMNIEGGQQWADITQIESSKNPKGHVAVLLDGRHYTYPRVINPIQDGRTQITGGYTNTTEGIGEAKDLANVLQAGQLPVSTVLEGSQTVGPSLGAENINNAMLSFLIAFLFILAFMAFYYAKAGLVSNVALIANLVFILGLSAAFTIVFTLPGLAAVVLTVGMAVDANVLIFERIREELAKDKTLKASIKAGFANAFSSVMDANITTFLTGVVLAVSGVGPIRGFAVSLMIGIVTSLISALIITRLILDYYANKGGNSINFGLPSTIGLFNNVKINMVSRRKFFYFVSGGAVAISLLAILFIGFKTGVDFKGGRQYNVVFMEQGENPAPKSLTSDDVEVLRKDLTDIYNNVAPTIKTQSASNRLMITTSYLKEDREADSTVKAMLLEGISKNYGDYAISIPESTDVGPTVAKDIQNAAYRTVFFSLLIIFFYILLRFRKWQYSLGAVIAVFHDVLIVLGIFSLLSLFDNLPINVEIDQALIAALLTIIGYSINDTVVVFDRIRENIGEMKSSKLSDIYNISIDQTISRTLITSATTFLSVLALFIWGGDTIRGFTFAIMIGVIVGTYSSIFVASPISLDTILRTEPELDEEQTKSSSKGKGQKKGKAKKA